MNSEERKHKFVMLLEELLKRNCDGIQARLAEKLEIRTSRISRWLAGQVDPINLETSIFSRIALMKLSSSEALANELGFKELAQNSPNKFRLLLEQILFNKTQEQLAELLNVSQMTISNWLNPEKNIDPAKISAGTMFTMAHEQRWTFDDLLVYLGLKDNIVEENLLIKYQSGLVNLSFQEKLKLLTSLSNSIQKTGNNLDNKQEVTRTQTEQLKPIVSLHKILIIIEQEDLAIASEYFTNLSEYLQLQPKNIKITTIPKLPQSLADIDILIFDINTADSPSIQLIEDLTFNGDIIVFADAIAFSLIRDKISSAVSEIFAKPVDWSAKQIFSLFSK